MPSAVPSWVSTPGATTPHVTGRAAASSTVDVSLQLPMRNQRLAEQYVAQGKVISQAEYDRTFGATQAQVDKVATWLRSRGVTVTSVDGVSGAVQAKAPVSTMQRASGPPSPPPSSTVTAAWSPRRRRPSPPRSA